jgi:L1 cell adhesion molecule like protein
VPQIEVSFDVDANGILNVSACDKARNETASIKITNDKGRLNAEEIERMVQEAEQFKEEDEKTKERIESKNRFEAEVFNIKNPPNKDKLSEEDIKTLDGISEEEIAWLDANGDEDAEVYTKRLAELQTKAMPIMAKCNECPGGVCQPGNMPGGMDVPSEMGDPSEDTTGPSIEEVD